MVSFLVTLLQNAQTSQDVYVPSHLRTKICNPLIQNLYSGMTYW